MYFAGTVGSEEALRTLLLHPKPDSLRDAGMHAERRRLQTRLSGRRLLSSTIRLR